MQDRVQNEWKYISDDEWKEKHTSERGARQLASELLRSSCQGQHGARVTQAYAPARPSSCTNRRPLFIVNRGSNDEWRPRGVHGLGGTSVVKGKRKRRLTSFFDDGRIPTVRERT